MRRLLHAKFMAFLYMKADIADLHPEKTGHPTIQVTLLARCGISFTWGIQNREYMLVK